MDPTADLDILFADFATPCTIRQPGELDIETDILFDEVSVTEQGLDTSNCAGTLRSAIIAALPRKEITIDIQGRGEYRALNPNPDGQGLTYVTLARKQQ